MSPGLVICCLVAALALVTFVCALLVEQKRDLIVELKSARGKEHVQRRRAERAEALVPGAVVYQFPTEGAS